MSIKHPAVFVDRDGTLMEEVGFCGDPQGVKLIPGASTALRQLREQGFRIVIVTNQSGIGRGYYSEQDFERVQQELFRQLGGAELVDATYFCPDHPEVKPSRRKPAPDMLLDAARDLGLDLSRSYMVGDREGDVGAGHNASCRSVLVLSGEVRDPGGTAADMVAQTIADAAEWILAHRQVEDAGLSVRSFQRLGEGDDSIAWLLNEQLVCRIPKHEDARESLMREAEVLPRISGALPLRVPAPEFRHGFSMHERIHGEPLTLSELSRLTALERERCLAALGEFLQVLQSNRKPEQFPSLRVADYLAGFADTAANAERVLFPQVSEEERRQMAAVLREWETFRFDGAPSLLHGDVSPDHILWDRETQRITGVIDFADIEFGDPAWDFIYFREDYNETILREVLRLGGFAAEELFERSRLLHAMQQIQYRLGR